MPTKLIIGLGNPDQEYENTRHNLGYLLIDHLAKKDGVDLALDKKTDAWTGRSKRLIAGKQTPVVFVRPESYVNTTGPIVAKLKNSLKVRSEDIIIIHDDLDIPFGNVKLSFDKNSGGHRGIESIMKALKTKKFFRIRLGISTPALQRAYQNPRTKDAFIKDFVLSKLTPKEKETLKQVFAKAVDLLESNGTQLAQ